MYNKQPTRLYHIISDPKPHCYIPNRSLYYTVYRLSFSSLHKED